MIQFQIEVTEKVLLAQVVYDTIAQINEKTRRWFSVNMCCGTNISQYVYFCTL